MNEFEEPDITVRLRDMAGGNEFHLAHKSAEVIEVLREIIDHKELLIQKLASLSHEFKRISECNLPPASFCNFARTVADNAIADIEKHLSLNNRN